MSEKQGLLERLLGGAKKKTENNSEALTAAVKSRLKGIVYDDALVDELTPVFVRLQGVEGFNTVMELLETKESQIEAISGGDWFKQDTDPEQLAQHEDETGTDSTNLVDSILSQKYGVNK